MLTLVALGGCLGDGKSITALFAVAVLAVTGEAVAQGLHPTKEDLPEPQRVYSSYVDRIGDPLLTAHWVDPDFDPKERAFYVNRRHPPCRTSIRNRRYHEPANETERKHGCRQ